MAKNLISGQILDRLAQISSLPNFFRGFTSTSD